MPVLRADAPTPARAMSRFEIYNGSALIGWSALELGDAPMGVAFGLFVPAPGYTAVKSIVVAAEGGPLPQELHLFIRDRSGATLEASGGVHIVDRSAEFGSNGLEVTILGVPYPEYERLFPEHVAAYERQFNNAG